MNLIWATRGRSWGFRFLLTGGLRDPLPAYERVFVGQQNETALCWRIGAQVALRFPDPLDRTDAAGRMIPHDFVIGGTLADGVTSVEEGLTRIWPLVADAYEQVWAGGTPLPRTIDRLMGLEVRGA